MARILRPPSAVAPHVEDRPHVQRAHRGMRVPGAARAVAREHLGQRVGVLGQVLQRHGAVFDEAHRLAVALQAHHDVQAGLAHFPQGLLRRLVGHLHHAAGQAQVAHQRRPGRAACAAARPRSAPANSTSRMACGLADQRRLRSSAGRPGWPAPARSSCGRPAPPRVGPSLTMCCAESIAWWKLGKLTTPSTLPRGSSLSFSVRLRVKASVPSRPPAGAPG